MINPVSISDTKNVFSDVSNKTSPSDYWLKKDGSPVAEIDYKIILDPRKAKRTNNLKIIGLSIAGTTILLAGTLFGIKKGPKGLVNQIAKYRSILQRRIEKARMDNPNMPDIKTFDTYALKILDNLSGKFEVINNFTTMKDFAFKEFMNNKHTGKITGRAHSYITRVFERIGRNALVKSYNKTKNSFINAKGASDFVQKRILRGNPNEVIEISGIKKTRAQWAEVLRVENEKVIDLYEKGFGEGVLFGRYKQIKTLMNNMIDKFKDKGHYWFWDKKTLNSFVADSSISSGRQKINSAVKSARNAISYSISDMASGVETSLSEVARSIDFRDVKSFDLINKIKQDVKLLSKSSDDNNIKLLKKNISAKLDLLKKQSSEFIDSKIESESNITIKSQLAKNKSDLAHLFNKIDSDLANYSSGKVEEILAIYKKLLPEKEYKDLENFYTKAVKSLDKSSKLETEDFVSKVRDLSLGSAPTDILTLLTSFLSLGYFLGTSDSKKERLSILVKYGIPGITGIGTSLYCGAKLFAGSKSLLFGLASTLISGKICSYINNFINKKYSDKESKSV